MDVFFPVHNLSSCFWTIQPRRQWNSHNKKSTNWFVEFSRIPHKSLKLVRLESVVRRCSVKKISQNSQENTRARVSFLMKLQSSFKNGDLPYCGIFENNSFYRIPPMATSVHFYKLYPADIYIFKVNNGKTRTISKICLKLLIETPKRRHWRHWLRSSVVIVNFEHISLSFLMFSLLTLIK